MVLYMGGRDRRERVREKKGKEEKKRERIVNIEYRRERKVKGGDFTPPSINGGEEEKSIDYIHIMGKEKFSSPP